MTLPVFPQLPDDDPLLALRNLRSYISRLVSSIPLFLVIAGTTTVLILAFALASVFSGFDVALSWAADLVPFTFAIISVVVSVKDLRDEHSNIVIAFVLFLGFAGTVVIHYTKALADRQHHDELERLGEKVDFVGVQNNQLLAAYLAKPAVSSQEDEMERRHGIEKALISKYVLHHDNISPGLLAGTEFPPAEWMNDQLRALGEKWTIATPLNRPSKITTEPKEPQLNVEEARYTSDDQTHTINIVLQIKNYGDDSLHLRSLSGDFYVNDKVVILDSSNLAASITLAKQQTDTFTCNVKYDKTGFLYSSFKDGTDKVTFVFSATVSGRRFTYKGLLLPTPISGLTIDTLVNEWD